MEPTESVQRLGQNIEARHASVLKCDLVSSTMTKRQLDLDGQVAFQRAFEKIITDAVTRFGAHINQFEGDGALIIVGFPNPAEDSAELAVKTGLELVRVIEKADILPGVQLHLRVGIASGQVAIVKPSLAGGGDIFTGTVIDLSERLRALAAPGQVVIDDPTKRLAGGFFDYDNLGKVTIKGFDRDVQAWRVLGQSNAASRFEAQRWDASRPNIIGRSEALESLSEAWKSSLGGHGQVVCLVGEAGIGKSRLARAVLDQAAQDGARTLEIDWMPSTGNSPLFSVGAMLRRIATIDAMTSQNERRTLAGNLFEQLLPSDEAEAAMASLAPLFGLDDGGGTGQSGANPVDEHEKMISAIVRLLTGFAAKQPLLLVCEDLHWIDDTSARALSRLSREIQQLSAMIIMTTRPTFEQLPLEIEPMKTIPLGPLDAEMSSKLVHSIVTDSDIPETVVQRIVERCEGVPLVLEEVTRSVLSASRSPEKNAGSAAIGSVPATLQLVIQSRLDRWPQFARIVQSASVVGREFPVSALEKLASGPERSRVEEAIDVMTREGLFDRREAENSNHVRFKHMMFCDIVYGTLLQSDRRKLHSDVADYLLDVASDAAPDVIAGHLRKARRFTEAIQVHYSASKNTAERGAFVESEGHCNAALALLDEVDEKESSNLHFLLLIQLGVVLTGRYGYSATAVEDAYRRAQSVCGDSAEAGMLYPIMRGLATVNLVRGKLAIAHDLSMQGFKLAEQSERVEFRIDAMSVNCYTTFYHGRLEECLDWITRCLELYRAEGGEKFSYPVPQDAATAAMALLPTVKWLLGDTVGAEEAVREGEEHVERLDRNFDRALMHAWIAGAYFMQRRNQLVPKHAEIAMKISMAAGYQEWLGIGSLLAFLARATQEADPDALGRATEICMEFEKQGVGLNASYYLWGLARGHVLAGNIAVARQLIMEAFRRADESDEIRMNAELLILQAELTAENGEATALLSRAIAVSEAYGAVAMNLRASAALVLRTASEDAEIDYAKATLDLLDMRTAFPAQSGWMGERLADLKNMIAQGRNG